MMRTVVDTNVIVSALAFGGVPRELTDLALTGTCFYFSAAIRGKLDFEIPSLRVYVLRVSVKHPTPGRGGNTVYDRCWNAAKEVR
jgi:hypothetical protein